MTGRRWSVEREVAAPPAAVWDLLTRTAAWPRWGPSVRSVDGPVRISAGSGGRLRPPLGPPVGFRITELVEGRRWSWSVGGVSATDHRVEPVDGGTRVTFSAPWWAPAYVPVLWLGLRRLADLAESPERT